MNNILTRHPFDITYSYFVFTQYFFVSEFVGIL